MKIFCFKTFRNIGRNIIKYLKIYILINKRLRKILRVVVDDVYEKL